MKKLKKYGLQTSRMTDYDFIGDIHGYSYKLEELLLKLDYAKTSKGYKHSNRKAFFVGDYIDRGPNNPRSIEIVRNMVDSDNAIALCGNHEHNAICFNYLTENGYLRKHSIKNFKQHSATLLQFHGNQSLYDDAIKWFKSLPLFYETETFNAVHATYDNEYLKENSNNGILSDEDYMKLIDNESDLANAVEITCKGKEIKIPDEKFFYDKDGTKRFHIRVKWWLNPSKHSLKDLSILEDLELSSTNIGKLDGDYYNANQKPVFFGHYWLKGEPNLQRGNICCLDYSIAKGGYLTAYRYSGEPILEPKNLIYV